MNLWIQKESDLEPTGNWEDSYIFTINREKYSTIYSNITTIWYHMDQMIIEPIYEDLFIIGLSIFAADKRVSRRIFRDCWTREISISIPVIEYEKWNNTVKKWESLLGFLTGDHWKISFRKTDKVFSYRKNKNRKHINVKNCDCVSLFSGGLDSFCGAIKLLQEGKSPCFVGHNEYPKLREKQSKFVTGFKQEYSGQYMEFISFSANSRAPRKKDGSYLKKSENTSRGRSLLFICTALSIAGIIGETTPVYIPENGFIGLNLPLTQSRIGTCSTRTTHPHFLRMFKEILFLVGIKNNVINFFAYLTKREIVCSVKDTKIFKQFYSETISCSHPCIARWNEKGSTYYPINCGYCYPCLIRKSSLLDVENATNEYTYATTGLDFLIKYEETEKINDLVAVLNAVYESKKMSDGELKRKIRHAGNLHTEEIEKYVRLYRLTINDLCELFLRDKSLYKILGV